MGIARFKRPLLSAVFLLTVGASGRVVHDERPAAALSVASFPSRSTSQDLDLCALMPIADVTPILVANVGVAVTSSQSHVGGMCSYRDPKLGAPRIRLLIDFTDHGTARKARAALASLRAMVQQRGLPITNLAGLGDEAFVASEGETEGVKVRLRGYMGQVNLTVDEGSPAAVREAARQLAVLTLSRLP